MLRKPSRLCEKSKSWIADPATPKGKHDDGPVADSMSCIRRARVSVPCAERTLRIARTDGLGDRSPQLLRYLLTGIPKRNSFRFVFTTRYWRQ